MILYVDEQLQRWAVWLRTGRTRLGYPSRAAFAAAIGGGKSSVQTLPDENAMIISHAVNALDGKLKEVVHCYYCNMPSCSVDEMAKHLGCCRDTVYTRLDMAHRRIMVILDSRDAFVSSVEQIILNGSGSGVPIGIISSKK